MSAIDKVGEYFDNQDRGHIHVEEWDLDIYWSPMTIGEIGRIERISKGNNAQILIECLVLKAEDADGKKLFTLEDKAKLKRKGDPGIMGRIVQQIAPDLEDDPEKN